MDDADEEFPIPPPTYAPAPDGHDVGEPFIPLAPAYHDGAIDDGEVTDGGHSDAASADGDDGDDIEALAAKACALASVPVPDYTEAFARKDRRVKKGSRSKYTTERFRDKVQARAARDTDPNSVVLANKTSNILSEFQDYITEIDAEQQGRGKESILEYSSFNAEDSVAGGSDGKGGGDDEEGGTAEEDHKGLIAREWNYDGYLGAPDASKNRNLYEGSDDYAGTGNDHDGPAHSGGRDGSYTFPLLHSKRVKIGVVWVIVLCVLIGTIVAISGGGKEDNPLDSLVREEGMGHHPHKQGIGHHPHNQDEEQNTSPAQDLELGKPHEGDGQPDGQSAHQDEMGAPTNQQDEGDESSEGSDSPSAAALPSNNDRPDGAPSAAVSIVEDELYTAALERYVPREFDRQDGWEGKTYLDAYRFCGELGQELCPYDAICPLGPDTQPLGGYREIDVAGESWTPISDGDNDWIQLSHENSCVRWSHEHPDPPAWGLDGNEDEVMVANILCCETP